MEPWRLVLWLVLGCTAASSTTTTFPLATTTPAETTTTTTTTTEAGTTTTPAETTTTTEAVATTTTTGFLSQSTVPVWDRTSPPSTPEYDVMTTTAPAMDTDTAPPTTSSPEALTSDIAKPSTTIVDRSTTDITTSSQSSTTPSIVSTTLPPTKPSVSESSSTLSSTASPTTTTAGQTRASRLTSKTTATSTEKSTPDGKATPGTKGTTVSDTSTMGQNKCQTCQAEESAFGRHGIVAFALSLSLAFLFLYALLMVLFMPKLLARCSKKSTSGNDVSGRSYCQKPSDMTVDLNLYGPGGPPQTMLVDDAEAPFMVTTDMGIDLEGNVDNAPERLSQGEEEKKDDEGNDELEPLGLNVSTFLLRHPSLAKEEDMPNKMAISKTNESRGNSGQGLESANHGEPPPNVTSVSLTEEDTSPTENHETAAPAPSTFSPVEMLPPPPPHVERDDLTEV